MFQSDTHLASCTLCGIEDGSPLLCTSTMRLLGLLIDQDLTWWAMVNDLVARASARIWTLVKLREFGATREQLVQNYTLKIRSVLEYCAPVIHCVISDAQSKCLENTQVRCCYSY